MSERDPIDWDELDAETQHGLVSLAEELGGESGESGGRTASRREFLGAITAAGLGGSLLSQGADRAFEDFVSPASAGTQSVAQFGEAGEPFDFVAEDIYGPGGQGSGDSVNFESISPDEINSAVYADPGDIQSKINEVAPGNLFREEKGLVKLLPGQDYSVSGIEVKRGVIIDFRGATVTNDADAEMFFIGHGAGIVDSVRGQAQLDVRGSGFSSEALVLDPSRTVDGDAYRANEEKQAVVKATLRGERTPASGSGGTALKLEANGAGITIGNHFVVDVEGFENGIWANPSNGGFVNGCSTFRVMTVNSRNHIRASTGSQGSGEDFAQRITGVIQASGERGVWNEGNGYGPYVDADWWDLGVFGTGPIIGPNVRFLNFQADMLNGHMDGSEGTVGVHIADGHVETQFAQSETAIGYEDINQDLVRWYTRNNADGINTIAILDDTNRAIQYGDPFFKLISRAEDLTARAPETDELAKHNGSGTPSESLCFEQAGSWYNIADGNTF